MYGIATPASVQGTKQFPTMMELLTNSTWLRTGILHGSDAIQCVADFSTVVDASPPSERMSLWLTESAASWNVSVARGRLFCWPQQLYTLGSLLVGASILLVCQYVSTFTKLPVASFDC